MKTYHRWGKIVLGETHATITQASGAITVAAILHAEHDADGQVVCATLDRCVHDDHTGFSGWTMSGCLATVMRREGADLDRRPVIRLHVAAVLEDSDEATVERVTSFIVEQTADVRRWSSRPGLDKLQAGLEPLLAGLGLPRARAQSYARRTVARCKGAVLA